MSDGKKASNAAKLKKAKVENLLTLAAEAAKGINLEVITSDPRQLPTGIDVLDVMTGGGFLPGGMEMVVGPPGVGKSTIWIQAVANLQKNNPEAVAVIIDAENAYNVKRLQALGVDPDRTLLVKENRLEKIYTFLKSYAELKEKENPDESVFIVWDSIAASKAQARFLDKNPEAGGTQPAEAIFLSYYLPPLLVKLMKAKIVLLAVNQLRRDVSMDKFKKDSSLPGLEGYSIPGGQAVLFFANHLIKLEPGGNFNTANDFKVTKARAKEFEELLMQGHVHGKIVVATMLKSRTSNSGIPFEMVMIPETGISNTLTAIYHMRNKGIIKTKGSYLVFAPDERFKAQGIRRFLELFKNEEFLSLFKKEWEALKEEYKKLVTEGFSANVPEVL